MSSYKHTPYCEWLWCYISSHRNRIKDLNYLRRGYLGYVELVKERVRDRPYDGSFLVLILFRCRVIFHLPSFEEDFYFILFHFCEEIYFERMENSELLGLYISLSMYMYMYMEILFTSFFIVRSLITSCFSWLTSICGRFCSLWRRFIY